ncbi:MAG: hypothetical protein EBE86_022895 [Hormoscilla sp. GUM202]|nr:hypothetical protein [Hormoscilla sp. GUM202]
MPQGIARLVNLLAQGEKMDIVIFYDGVNDVATSCNAELELGEHFKTVKIRKRIQEGSLNDDFKLYLTRSEF